MAERSNLIRAIYLYVVSLVALLMVVFSMADLINLGLKTWVFPKADRLGYSSYACPPEVIKTGVTSTAETAANCPNLKQDQENYTVQKQSAAVRDLSFVFVGIPLFIFHWSLIKKDRKEKENEN